MRMPLLFALAVSVMATWPAFAQEPGYTVSSDIAYGELPRQTLDIYTPDALADDTPVLVYLFGGGFTTGDKGQGRVIGQRFAATGTLVVSPNYRIYPEGQFPAFIADAAMAVAYVRDHLTNSAGDPRPIVVSGWSAGAYIGALLSYDQRYLAAEGVSPGAIAGVIGLSGPYRGGLCAGLRCPEIFPPGTEADWPVASFVDPGDPPMLLVYGLKDRFVAPDNHRDLAAAGLSAGLDVTTIEMADGYHRDPKSDMEDPGTDVRTAVDAFLARVSGR